MPGIRCRPVNRTACSALVSTLAADDQETLWDEHGGTVEATESASGGALFRARIPVAGGDRAEKKHSTSIF